MFIFVNLAKNFFAFEYILLNIIFKDLTMNKKDLRKSN